MKLIWQNKSQESLKHLKPVALRYVQIVTERFELSKDEVSITMISKPAMKKMNHQYRGINQPTDVLTFVGDNNYLGDIVICYPVVVEKAMEHEMTTLDYFRFTVVHGLLHAMGYDHQTNEEYDSMMRLQDEILKQGVV